MEIEEIRNLSKYSFEKALSNIEIAKELYKTKRYEFALNRAYYSVFDAMRSINALDKFDSSKHSGVISHFNHYYVKTGIFPS